MKTKNISACNAKKGFTLAELLISLAILGVIATFTIPKILGATSGAQPKAVTKEVIGMISGAFSTYQQTNNVTATTKAGDLAAYMNYVKQDAAGAFTAAADGLTNTAADCVTASNTLSAGASATCMVLHNGAILQYVPDQDFDAVDGAHYITFNVDPDGKSGSYDSVQVLLYDNGRITTLANVSGTAGASGLAALTSTADPSWFSWN